MDSRLLRVPELGIRAAPLVSVQPRIATKHPRRSINLGNLNGWLTALPGQMEGESYLSTLLIQQEALALQSLEQS